MNEIASAAAAASAAISSDGVWWLLSSKEWFLLVFGAILGLLMNVIWVVFPNLAYRLPFLYPRHTAKLQGTASLLHHLSARTGDPAKSTAVDLSASFRHPGQLDGVEWNVTNLSIRTRWNRDAMLTCTLTWAQAGEPWTAEVKGKGRYFARNDEDFNGYVYVVCDCVGHSNKIPLHWKVVYELKRKQLATAGWDGYWLMFDADDATHSKFGLIDLKFAQ